MLKAYKYRLSPNPVQQQYFAQAFGCARLLYNQLLDWWIVNYRIAKQNDTQMENLPLVTFFKKQFPFLKDIDALALMNARRNFEASLKNYFQSKKGKRKGKKVGFPTFKKKGVSKDSFTTNNIYNNIRILDNSIKLPKIGYVKFVNHRPLPADSKIIAVNVSKTPSNIYYISVMVECADNYKVRNNVSEPNVVGLDMSLSQFVVDSDNTTDNTKTKYVRQYRKNERRLKRLQRILSRRQLITTDEMVYSKKKQKNVPKVERSKNREKARLRLAKLHQHISNCRRDFSIKQALYYARNYDVVVIEDINLQDMQRTLHLGKSISDLGFGIFKEWLSYKCDEYDTLLVKTDKWYASSKTCSKCGYVNSDLRLSDRKWTCPDCGEVHDRDYNAACNLRDWYYNHKEIHTAGTAGINAYGDTTSVVTDNAVITSGVVEVGSTHL